MILLASLTLLSCFIASSNTMDRNTTEIVSTRLIVMNTEAPESTTLNSNSGQSEKLTQQEAPESPSLNSTSGKLTQPEAPESTTLNSISGKLTQPEAPESPSLNSTSGKLTQPEAPESTTLNSISDQSEKLTQQEASCSADICGKLCPRAYFTCDKTLTTCICKNSPKYNKLDASCSRINSTDPSEWPPYADASEVTALYSTCARITQQILLSGYYLPRLYLCKGTSSVNHGVCYFESAY